jgi:hypothetical protein
VSAEATCEARAKGTRVRLKVMIRTCAWLLVAALFAAGCASPSASPEEALIRATVERYDALLAQGYRSMDMSPMSQVATRLQAETEYIHMSSLAEGGVRLLPELKKMEFVQVSIESTTALAVTLETWDYTHVHPTTGEVIREQTGLVYRLAWDLVKETDGRWLVSDVRSIDVTTTGPPVSLEPSGSQPKE